MTAQRPDFYLGTDIDGVQLNAEQLNVRSRDLNSLIGSVTYTDALYHILRGKLPTPEERQLFDIVLVAFHGGFGLLPPTTFVPRIVAGTGVGVPQALAAGFLASGPYHVGAVEHAMKYYDSIATAFREQQRPAATAGELEQFAYDMTAQRLAAGETVAGFGHPLLRKDPRPTHVRRLLCELKAESIYFDIYDGVVRCLDEKKGVPANVDGITAAILLRLGFTYQYGTGLFLHARSSAMLAHIIEEQTDMPYQTMRRFMLLPILSPKLFNANVKAMGKRFNKWRDSKVFKSLKGLFSRRENSQFAAQEAANREVIRETRPDRVGASVVDELSQTRHAPLQEDPFVAATRGEVSLTAEETSEEDVFSDCSSPELMAGAAFFLSSCLRSLHAQSGTEGAEQDARTQQLIQSALQLVEQAGSLGR